MAERKEWQSNDAAAEFYENHFVPAIFADWALPLTNAADVVPGQRILDVACGTGIVARIVADRVEERAGITGIDLRAGMARVAQRLQPNANWVQADIARMPFADGNFDVVLCQQALMFFPDKVAALREMRRVLRWSGRIAVSVAGASPGVGVIAEILENFAGKEAANVFLSAFALREPSDVTTLFDRAGFKSANLQTVHRAGRYPSIEACLLTHVGFFLAGCIDVDAMLTTTRGSLEPFCTAAGAVHIPMEVHITTASKD